MGDKSRAKKAMIRHRNAFGDADDQFHLGINRFEDRVGCKWRRHIDAAGGCAGQSLGFGDSIIDGEAKSRFAALAGGDACDHLRAIGQRCFGVEQAGRACHALGDDLCILVD